LHRIRSAMQVIPWRERNGQGALWLVVGRYNHSRVDFLMERHTAAFGPFRLQFECMLESVVVCEDDEDVR
jgi:hypothetical protein